MIVTRTCESGMLNVQRGAFLGSPPLSLSQKKTWSCRPCDGSLCVEWEWGINRGLGVDARLGMAEVFLSFRFSHHESMHYE